jgi:hypothetical protein
MLFATLASAFPGPPGVASQQRPRIVAGARGDDVHWLPGIEQDRQMAGADSVKLDIDAEPPRMEPEDLRYRAVVSESGQVRKVSTWE